MLNSYASEIGTKLHEVAYKYILHRFKMLKQDKKSVVLDLIHGGIPDRVVDMIDFDSMYLNLMTYVNDANAYGMMPEVILYYSDNCFGTADSISFSDKKKELRIHDLKTGISKTHIEQLLIYAALFCLEYRVKPEEITTTELRIYQSNEVLYHNPSASEIRLFMEKIIERDRELSRLQGRSVDIL